MPIVRNRPGRGAAGSCSWNAGARLRSNASETGLNKGEDGGSWSANLDEASYRHVPIQNGPVIHAFSGYYLERAGPTAAFVQATAGPTTPAQTALPSWQVTAGIPVSVTSSSLEYTATVINPATRIDDLEADIFKARLVGETHPQVTIGMPTRLTLSKGGVPTYKVINWPGLNPAKPDRTTVRTVGEITVTAPTLAPKALMVTKVVA